MDMTNSFFQMLMKPDDGWKTAATTPFRLYEWIVMPMKLHNPLLIHQQCVTAALQHLIGNICHMYIDDNVKKHKGSYMRCSDGPGSLVCGQFIFKPKVLLLLH